MTSVIVLGPNLIDQSKGDFHVHAEGCRDLATYYGSEHASDKANPLNMNSVEEIAEYVYADMLADNDVSNLVNDFYVFPCVVFPTLIHKPAPAIKSWRVTFELYNEDLFFEMEIITSDANLSNTVALLESVPNVRQVNVTRES